MSSANPRMIEDGRNAIVQITENELIFEREEDIVIEVVEEGSLGGAYPSGKRTTVTVQVVVNDQLAPEENYIVCCAAGPKAKKSRREMPFRSK